MGGPTASPFARRFASRGNGACAGSASTKPSPTRWPPSFREGLPRAVAEYLADLPETRRTALVLRHALGYSIEEVAELTGVSPNTVKDRLLAAREQVRKHVRRDIATGASGRRSGS